MPDEKKKMEDIDAAYVMTMLREFKQGLDQTLRDISNRLSILQKDNIQINASIQQMAKEYSETRVKRLEDEAAEAEREMELLQKELDALNEKLERKKSDTVNAMSTNERVQKSVTLTVEQMEQNKKDLNAAVWKKRIDSVITAIMVAFSVPIGLAIAVAIIRFIAGVFKIDLP